MLPASSRDLSHRSMQASNAAFAKPGQMGPRRIRPTAVQADRGQQVFAAGDEREVGLKRPAARETSMNSRC